MAAVVMLMYKTTVDGNDYYGKKIENMHFVCKYDSQFSKAMVGLVKKHLALLEIAELK